jgi:hypothetical protein
MKLTRIPQITLILVGCFSLILFLLWEFGRYESGSYDLFIQGFLSAILGFVLLIFDDMIEIKERLGI